MRARLTRALLSVLGVALVWATWKGWSRGGQDFRVFHYAGQLVLDGRWDALYTEGPDRYLYAPGFAFLISPLAFLPASAALALWLVGMLVAFIATLRALALRYGILPVVFASLFFIRAVAIDLRYGQVNLFILAAAVFASLSWAERTDTPESRRRLGISWFFFAVVAFAKIYPLALFLFPAAGLLRGPENFRAARIAFSAAALGAAVLLIPPLFISGVYPAWFDALARKGLPTDTHNQSFLAFLVRVFGGEPFYALGMGGEALRFDMPVLALTRLRGIWLGYSAFILALLARLAFFSRKATHDLRLAFWLGIALCFLPAHLIWKSYFVLGIPLVAAVFAQKKTAILYPAIVAGVFICFTSGDFVGPRMAGWIEALSPFFWIHGLAIATGFSILFSRTVPRSS